MMLILKAEEHSITAQSPNTAVERDGPQATLAGALAALGLPPAAGVLTLPVVWELS